WRWWYMGVLGFETLETGGPPPVRQPSCQKVGSERVAVDAGRLVVGPNAGHVLVRFRLEEAPRNECLTVSRVRTLLGVVGLDGRVDDSELGLAGRLLTILGDTPDGEDDDRGEHAENDDDDQELDEREAAVLAAGRLEAV